MITKRCDVEGNEDIVLTNVRARVITKHRLELPVSQVIAALKFGKAA
jgi:hypothetical protein